jgi:Subtilase family
MSDKPQRRARKNGVPPMELPPAQLIVGAHGAEARITRRDIADSEAAESNIRSLLPEATTLQRVFGDAPRLRIALRETSEEDRGADLLNTFSATGATGDLDELATALNEDDDIAYAYVIPSPQPPIAPHDGDSDEPRPDPASPPQPDVAPPVTPDFTSRQGYLDAAPDGVDARWAWTRPGGQGTGVHVIDIEGAWRFTHEDLTVNQGGVIAGTESTDIRWRNHGTAVIGAIGGDENTYGITGIAPHAQVRAISVFGSTGVPGAITQAAQALSAGDIILIELHAPGPLHNFQDRPDQDGFIAMEWWPAIFDAIRFAIAQGVVVVEAAGNGAQDFDDPLYETRPAGFPATWQNPLRSSGPDSGAILVGAGAPPPGTHSRDHGPARSRLGFSNWGSRVDVQGWGEEVTTSGYGWLQGGMNEDLWYTDQFNGTSSASPVVVGAVAAYQGISAAGSGRKTPAQMRTRLRNTGSAQQDAPGRPATQRIGRLPNLRSMVGGLGGTKWVKDVKDVKAEKLELKDHVKEIKIEKEPSKEKLEIKDGKREKSEIKEKEIREYDIKQLRDIDVKRVVEIDGKQIVEVDGKLVEVDGKVVEVDDRFRGRLGYGGPTDAAAGSSDARLAALEARVNELTHFIAQVLRPDLSGGALGYDEDDDTDWQQP